MGKELSLFENDFDAGQYRYSVWITNSKEAAYEVWKQCRSRANDENTIKELKEDFALGGFSMKYFYSTEAAMLMRVFIYNLFVLFRQEILGQKEKPQQMKTLRYKYFVIPGQLGRDGKRLILRISAFKQKIKLKLIYLYNRINRYSPYDNGNCNAVG